MKLIKWTFGLALLVAFGFAGCDALTEPEEAQLSFDTEAFADDVEVQATLTNIQRVAFDASMDRRQGEEKEPGYLWELAAETEADLTDEQYEALLEEADGKSFGRRNFRGGSKGAFEGGHGRAYLGGRFISAIRETITDEQKESLSAIKDSYKEDRKALRASVKAEEITKDEYRDQLTALLEAMQAEVDAILTDEQKQAIEDAKAERLAEQEAWKAAEQQAMVDVLGLDDGQTDAIVALQDAMFEDFAALKEEMTNSGTKSREAVSEAVAELQANFYGELEGVLDADQYRVFRVHDALEVTSRGHWKKGDRKDRDGEYKGEGEKSGDWPPRS